MTRTACLVLSLIVPALVVACGETTAPATDETAAGVGGAGAAAIANSAAGLLYAFDESAGENPEGIAVDKTGNIFVSASALGQIWIIRPGSAGPEVFGAVAGIDPFAGDVGILGLAVDAPGNVYAGVQSSNQAANGVWVFDRKTGAATRIPGSEQIGLANDVAFDKRGTLYITDSAAGAIWRVPKNGALEAWLTDEPLLAGTGALGLGVPIGANGIEYRQGTLYVANTEQALIVTIPVGPRGAPGPATVLTSFPVVEVAPGVFQPGVPDGLAFDVHGTLYVAQINISTVAAVALDGTIETVHAGDPLDWPSSIAFGTGRGYGQTLFAVNFSIGEANGDLTDRAGPGVVALPVGMPGMPVP